MERKFIVVEKSEVNDVEQSIVGWGSKPIPDRDGELIESTAWNLDDYRKNPILCLCHDYSVPPVGKILWVKSDSNGLKFKARFANTERGREIYQLYKEGIMSAFSVGFTPIQPGGVVNNPTDVKYKGLKKVYKSVNLLEISCVPIPSCSEALVEYVKSGKIQTKQLKEEMDHVVEIVEKDIQEKGKSCPVEGGTFGADNGKHDECKTCAKGGACSAETKDIVEIETKEIITKPETTDTLQRVPIPAEEGKHDGCKIRTIDISKKDGIQALYCVDDKTVITYLFDKEKFSLDEAKKWVEEHTKSFTIVLDGEEIIVKAVEPPVDETKTCPADGGVFGKDKGKFAECKECTLAEGCGGLTKSEEEIVKKDDEESETKDLDNIETKVTDSSGLPSIYDITSAVSQALGGPTYNTELAPGPTSKYRYVVDLFPSSYPSGSVVYCESGTGESVFYKINYTYANDGSVSFVGTPSEVDQAWVLAKYGPPEVVTKVEEEIEKKETKTEEEIETKAGRVLSDKNRKLLVNCATQMKEAISAIDDLITATELPIDTAAISVGKDVEEEVIKKDGENEEEDGLEIETKDVEEIEIEEKVVEHVIEVETKEPEDKTFEIDGEQLREILTRSLKSALIDGVKEGVGVAIRKAQGKVL